MYTNLQCIRNAYFTYLNEECFYAQNAAVFVHERGFAKGVEIAPRASANDVGCKSVCGVC